MPKAVDVVEHFVSRCDWVDHKITVDRVKAGWVQDTQPTRAVQEAPAPSHFSPWGFSQSAAAASLVNRSQR